MILTNNNNRLLSIDLARGLAVFFMISVHTLDVFANAEVKNSIFGQIITFLGGAPAAPVFMTLMGVSFVYSRKSEFIPKLLRGFRIFLSGYILNIFRGVIPYKISKYADMNISKSFPIDKLNEYTIFTIIDILQFAGIALMIMAILQQYKINKNILLIAAFIIIIIAPFLWGIKLDLPIIDFVLDLFWGDQPISQSFISNKIAFPIFPWLAFPLMGMYLGETILNSNDQNLTFKYFGITGLLVLLAGLAISAFNFEFHFNDYFHSRQSAMILMCGFVVCWLYLCRIIVEKLPMNSIFTLLFKWSSGVTNIYFVQWVVITWSIGIFGINKSNITEVIILIFTFSLISHSANELICMYNKPK